MSDKHSNTPLILALFAIVALYAAFLYDVRKRSIETQDKIVKALPVIPPEA